MGRVISPRGEAPTAWAWAGKMVDMLVPFLVEGMGSLKVMNSSDCHTRPSLYYNDDEVPEEILMGDTIT